MLKIAMVDDERLSLDLFAGAFRQAFAQSGEQTEIFAFVSPETFFATLCDTQYDLICLDINMEGMSGIEVAAKIRENNPHVPLAFISSNENRVFECFAFQPIGFIRKANFLDDSIAFIKHYLTTVLPRMKTKNTLMVKIHRDTAFIDVDNISYIEGGHNYQTFYFLDGSPCIEVRELISNLEKRLSPYGFIRTHKGFIVNFTIIQRIGSSEIMLKNGQSIPLSLQRREEVMKRYLELTKDTLMVT
ncbi:MAG: response regulator transcription factor [Bacilli bacterium]|nr:response regulator transcription factor [Bacilli bacterium]